jgi:hypothetical protein
MTFLEGYSAKLIEYIVAVSYLILFVGFWKFTMSPTRQEARS